MVISGTGGALAITVVERKDPLDFALLVRQLVRIDAKEPLTPMHPVLGMIQTLAEPTDPINYSPYWFSQPGWWPNQVPLPVLVTSGTSDAATPYRTSIALASAARLPLVGEPATSTIPVDLRTGPAADLPQVRNALGFDSVPLTAGFHQFWEGSHGVVFQSREASDVYVGFLTTAADGLPVLTPDGTTDP